MVLKERRTPRRHWDLLTNRFELLYTCLQRHIGRRDRLASWKGRMQWQSQSLGEGYHSLCTVALPSTTEVKIKKYNTDRTNHSLFLFSLPIPISVHKIFIILLHCLASLGYCTHFSENKLQAAIAESHDPLITFVLPCNPPSRILQHRCSICRRARCSPVDRTGIGPKRSNARIWQGVAL